MGIARTGDPMALRRTIFSLALSLAVLAAGTETGSAADTPPPIGEDEEAWPPDFTTTSFADPAWGHDLAPWFESAWGDGIVLARTEDGRFVNKRTNRPLGTEEITAAVDAAAAGGDGIGITFLHTEREWFGGLTAGMVKRGEIPIARGRFGEASVDLLGLWSASYAGIGLTPAGLIGGGGVCGSVTLLGLTATSDVARFGDKRSPMRGLAYGTAWTSLGADVSAGAYTRLGWEGVSTGARLGAFAGATLAGFTSSQLSFHGVAINALFSASVGYGVGADTGVYFKIDWTRMTARIGAKVMAGAGLATGIGIEVELSIDRWLRNHGATRRLRAAALEVAGLLKSGIAATARGARRAIDLVLGEPSADCTTP